MATPLLSIVASPAAAFSWSADEIQLYLQQRQEYCSAHSSSGQITGPYRDVCTVYNDIIKPVLQLQKGVKMPYLEARPKSEHPVHAVSVHEAPNRRIVISDFYSAFAFIINVAEFNHDQNRLHILNNPGLCRQLVVAFGKMCHTMHSRHYDTSHKSKTSWVYPTMVTILFDNSVPQNPNVQLSVTAAGNSVSSNTTQDWALGPASLGASLPSKMRFQNNQTSLVKDKRKDTTTEWRMDTLRDAMSPQILQQAPLRRDGRTRAQGYGHCAETNPFVTRLPFGSNEQKEFTGFTVRVGDISKATDLATANSIHAAFVDACDNCVSIVTEYNSAGTVYAEGFQQGSSNNQPAPRYIGRRQ